AGRLLFRDPDELDDPVLRILGHAPVGLDREVALVIAERSFRVALQAVRLAEVKQDLGMRDGGVRLLVPCDRLVVSAGILGREPRDNVAIRLLFQWVAVSDHTGSNQRDEYA